MSRKQSKTLAEKLQDIAYWATLNGQLFSALFHAGSGTRPLRRHQFADMP